MTMTVEDAEFFFVQSIPRITNTATTITAYNENFPIQTQIRFNENAVCKIKIDNLSEEKILISDLVKKDYHKFCNGELSIKVLPESIAINDVSAGVENGEFAVSVFTRTPREGDLFYVRFETEKGSVGFSKILAPFADKKFVAMNVLKTERTLDYTAATTGFKSRQKLADNEIVKRNVNPAIFRSTLYSFENGSEDSLGERPIPGGRWSGPIWHDQFKMLRDGGVAGKKYLALKNGEELPLHVRTIPLTACTIQFDVRLDVSPSKKSRLFGRKSWNWGSAFDIYVEKDGTIVASKGFGRSPESDYVAPIILKSNSKLKVGEWTRITLVFDERIAKIYLNGCESTSAEIPMNRGFGHESPYLGDASSKLQVSFDNLMLLSRPMNSDEIISGYNGDYGVK